MRISIVFLLLLAFTLNTYSQNKTALKYTYDKENVVSSVIDGTWKHEKEDVTLLFEKDTTAVSLVPEKFHKNLADKTIYHAGFLTLSSKGQEMKVLFILTTIHGNPHLVMFRDRNGSAYSDSESCNLFIAKAKSRVDDRLFLGGDFNNQEFRELVRIE